MKGKWIGVEASAVLAALAARARCAVLRLTWLAAVAVMALSIQPATGQINIMPVFDAAYSEFPPFDPTGAGLTALFNEAELRYEAIIMDMHPLTVYYRYEDIPKYLATCTEISSGGNPVRTTQCLVRVDTRVGTGGAFHDWFIDATPATDSEFDMIRFDYRTLPTAQQADFFNGTPPDMLEDSYVGAATAPAAIGRTDLFSVVMHEIGHALGVSSSAASVAEAADGDYDIPPAYVGGTVMAVNAEPDPERAPHLAGVDMLMNAGIPPGTRRLPSLSDLFSMGKVQQYNYLYLTEREFLGGIDLNDNSSWMGGYAPNIVVNGYVRPNLGVTPYAVTTGYMGFGNLSILEGATVTTNHTIDVWETATIQGDDGETSRLRVQSGGILNTTDLVIRLDGALTMIGGAVNVSREIRVGLTGSIEGYGTITVDSKMFNDGLIAAEGGLLTLIGSSPTTYWGLSFDPAATIEAVGGDMTIQSTDLGTFEGDMTVGAGRTMTIDGTWELESFGNLYLNGVEGSPAELAAPDTTISGSVEVNGEAEISGTVLFIGGDIPGHSANVHVPTASDVLTISALTTFQTGAYWGDGTIVQAADFTVEGGPGTTIFIATYDWGNSRIGQSNDTLVDGTTLTINSPTTGTPDNEYRGVIRLQDGTLAVNTASGWTLPAQSPPGHGPPEGTLHLANRGGATAPTVEGQELTLGGSLYATGGLGVIAAPFVTTPTATMDVAIGAEVELRGATTWNGGSIRGDGGIRQIADATVVGNTNIAPYYYDWDGDDAAPSTTTVQNGATLQIGAAYIENTWPNSFDGTVNVNTAALNVSGVSSWQLGNGAAMNLAVGLVSGADIGVFGQISATGEVNEIAPDVTFYPSAAVTVAGPGDGLTLSGQTTYQGGSYTGSGMIVQSGDATVQAATTIDVGTFDMDGLGESTTITMTAPLTLNVSQVDTFDNVFDGTIIALAGGATLTVNVPGRWQMNGALDVSVPSDTGFYVAGSMVEHIGVAFVNIDTALVYDVDVAGPGTFMGPGNVIFNGAYEPGTSPGVGSFGGGVGFGPAGSLVIEIGGYVAGVDYDVVNVTGAASLGGTLAISLINSFMPQVGDEFEIMTYASRNGQFASLSGHLLGGIALFPTYGANWPTALTLTAALTGDATLDNCVDGLDYVAWSNNYISGDTWGEGDFNADGVTDGLDYVMWSNNYLQGCPSVPGSVPEPTAVSLLALGGLALIRRRRRA